MPVLGQPVRDSQQHVHLAPVTDQGDVVPFAGDTRLAEGHQHLTLRHLAFGAVERARLEEDDRVGLADGGQHHPFGVVRRHRGDDL